MFLLLSCTQEKEQLTVHLKVKNPTHAKATIARNPESVHEAELDKNGDATASLQGELTYAHLLYGQEFKSLFLQQGAPLTISFDGGNFRETVQFEGKTAPINEYLNEVTYTPLSPEVYAHSFDELLTIVRQRINEATQTLHSKKLETISPEFVELETARIRYTYAVNILMYPMGHIYAIQDTSFLPGEEYYKQLNQLMQGNEKLLHLPIYREFVAEAALILSSPGKRIPDATQRRIAQMNYISEHLLNDSVKQAILHDLTLKQNKKH